MLRDADIAMYEAKARGESCHVVFSSEMRECVRLRVETENDLCDALGTAQLHLVYQPIVSLDDRSLCGVESFVRWTHPLRGNIPPDHFISIAEESRLMLPLSEWILRESCEAFMRWQRTHPAVAPAYMSFNLSRMQLSDPSLVERTMAARLAMDDVDTGYSSLSCLQEFPLDVLKVDRSFVANAHHGRDYAARLHAVVTLADNLGRKVVAEGIEHEAQLVLLQALGCACGQGYRIARPMNEVAITALLDTIAPQAIAPALRLLA